MTSWKAYVLCATILPLIRTENNQRGHKLETITTLNSQQPYGYEEMSEEHKIEVGNRIEPVIFEPQRKIKLSRSTYKVTSYVDFKPYKQSFKQFGQYMGRFLVDLRDPHYISTLYVVRRRGRLAPRQPLSVCALLPAYEGNRHLRPLGNLGHRLRRPRWID